ncbi:hypothetical protein Smp_055640 [Schistosoma mansoni]|uniref:hypothetical protein n=1 Tax=Schistosoma mansoni TaxID=6183 RepID=UPI0001A64240|nr:hypothetical protein Smp_055640 [Schistosoma mansoni]|eukprot:XP_018652456.1 hypothetical protein Smp_055640 [Schistosoma mansoni]
MVDREINEDNKENRILLVDHHCNINAIDKNQPNSNITLTKSGISINKISHLNYIEPYNLDLRTVQCSKEHGNGSVDGSGSSNLSSSRTNTLTTTSVLKTGSALPILTTTTTIINSDISSNVIGSLNMSNTVITSVCSNSFDKQLSTNDDEHIEYREIDPIGTNALAIVKERFG